MGQRNNETDIGDISTEEFIVFPIHMNPGKLQRHLYSKYNL